MSKKEEKVTLTLTISPKVMKALRWTCGVKPNADMYSEEIIRLAVHLLLSKAVTEYKMAQRIKKSKCKV